MSCNNYTTTKIPVSIGFDANGNAGSLIESKEVVVTKISAYTDPASDQTYDIEIDPGVLNKVIIKSDVTVQGALTAQSTTILGASALSSLTDVTITSVADGEVLVWSSNDWINRTLSEAGILGTTDLANYATNTYVSSNYATSNSLSAYAPSSWVNSNFLGTGTLDSTTQRYGAALQALRTLATTNNTLPYFTGGAAATTTLTPFAKNSILAATDGLTVVANIGAQPFDNNLQNIVAIGTPGAGTDTYVIAWNETNGEFELQPQTGGLGSLDLNSLTDVTISTASNNDFLVYNGSQWVDQDQSVARTSLGATTLGGNLFTATNNSTGGDTYLKINSTNGVSLRTAAQMRTDLTAQEQNSTLTNIATQTPTANTLIYFDGSTNAATTTLTSFGRSLLDDANATECRGTLSAQLSSVPLGNLTDLCTGAGSTGASATGRLLYTVENGLVPGTNILPVSLFSNTNIPSNYGKVLSLRDPNPGANLRAVPQFQFLFFGELGNVNLGGGAGQGGELTAGSILYVDGSKNLTELAKPGGDSFLKHNGTTPSWRSAADVRTDIGAQASDPTLTALAGVTTANDTIIYFTGVDSATSTGLTTAGRKIISCPDTLAAGDIFYYDGTNVKKLPKPADPAALVFEDGANAPKWVQVPDKSATYFLKSTAGVLSWGGV